MGKYNRCVSVSGPTYARLRRRAQRLNVSMAQILDEEFAWLPPVPNQPPPTKHRVPDGRAGRRRRSSASPPAGRRPMTFNIGAAERSATEQAE